MKARRETVGAASAVSAHDPATFAQAVAWVNAGGCYLQLGARAPVSLSWEEAEAVVEVLRALMEADDE